MPGMHSLLANPVRHIQHHLTILTGGWRQTFLCSQLVVEMKQFDITNHEKPEWPNQETHSLHTREIVSVVQPSSNPSPVKSQQTSRLATSPLAMATCGVSPLGTSLGPMSPLSNHEDMSVAWLFANGLVLWGEHFDWIKRDVATLLVKGNDVYTTLEALGVLYHLYLFIFLWVLNSIHFCWCHVVLRLCYALLLSKSSLW